jgi:transglutaminase-like putative cysteine protease
VPRVRIHHTTEYQYAAPVKLTEHRLMMRPRDSHDLRLLDATLWITPPGARTRWAHDVFGNSVCFLDWRGATTKTLRIISALDLQHYPVVADLPIDPSAQTYPFRYAGDEYPDLSRLIEPHHPDPDRQVEGWARRFLKPTGNTPTRELLIAITEAIKSDFVYEARESKGTHAPLHTLSHRRGACRDFAVLMMEAARSLGFAARFVSGYLYDEALVDSVDAMVGGGSTHAWCAIYLPGAGWVEYDPTNGLIAGRNLIRVSMAREPHQATPLSGGYIGRADDFRSMRIEVKVTVGDPPTPEEEEEALKEAAGKEAAEARAAEAAAVPEAPEKPLDVVADRPLAAPAEREIDFTTS